MPTESTVLHNDPDFDWHWTRAEWTVRLQELERTPDLEIEVEQPHFSREKTRQTEK